MKKIIDGKRYDTETAERVHSWHNGYHAGDFHQCEEALYRTRKGTFFLHGEGGALSKYATPHGNMTGGGEDITPLTPKEAMEWLEAHDGTEALEKNFKDAITEA